MRLAIAACAIALAVFAGIFGFLVVNNPALISNDPAAPPTATKAEHPPAPRTVVTVVSEPPTVVTPAPVVEPPVVDATRRFYASFKPPQENVVLVADKPAGHGMITADAGVACDVTAAPFINDCGYDAAGELLAHLLGPLEPAAAKEAGRILRVGHAAADSVPRARSRLHTAACRVIQQWSAK